MKRHVNTRLTAVFQDNSGKPVPECLSPHWILLELRMMEVMVTTAARRRVKLQSSSTNQHPGCPSCRPTNSVRALKGGWVCLWKEFWKSVNIWQSYGQEYSVVLFWLTVYSSTHKVHVLPLVHLGLDEMAYCAA